MIQPGKRALNVNDPSSATLCMAHAQQRKNVARSQTLPDGRGVAGAITQHAVRPAPRSSSFALQRRNRIDERQHPAP